MNDNLLPNILMISLLAGLTTLPINFTIARMFRLLLAVPHRFAPFAFFPIATGCFGGAMLAGVVYYVLHFIFERPPTAFIFTSGIALFFSFHLPFRLTNHRSERFAGATHPIQLVLCLMHTIVAITSVSLLLVLT